MAKQAANWRANHITPPPDAPPVPTHPATPGGAALPAARTGPQLVNARPHDRLALGRPDARPTAYSAVRRAVRFLKKEQEYDGCWYGRWGVNYIYGTHLVLQGLASVKEDMTAPYLRKAVRWLLDHQNEDGGWGETIASYDNPDLRGQGPSTPSQTAWAITGLMAAGEIQHPAVSRGVDFLLDRQTHDGTWEEEEWTGTGFPKVFYLRYHFYRHYFPLAALGRFHRLSS